MKKPIFIILIMLVTAASINAQHEDFPRLTDPCLDQELPEMTPETFAAEIPTAGGFGVYPGGVSRPQSVAAPQEQAPRLDEKLSIFRPFIGTNWVGSPDYARMGEITLKWEIILNGYAVRLKRNILNSDHWLETTYYWDESSGKIAYLAISNNGVVTKGYVAGQEGGFVSEGDQRGPEVNRKARRTYKLDKGGKLYEDDLFRNSDAEEWQRTHVSVFVSK
jgi:hypothetical protein